MRCYASLIKSLVSFSSEGAAMNSKPPTDVAASQSSHPDVVFEDFIFYAGLQREEENNGQKVFSPNPETNIQIEEETRSTSENKTNEEPRGLPAMTPDQQERSEAARALRIASWMSVFFLLTTDIVGPFTAPFAISQVGWVPGIILFIIRCVFFSVIFLSLINRHVSSGYTIVILRDSNMGTICSTRFPPVSTQNICRYSGPDLRTICMSHLQSSAIDPTINQCTFDIHVISRSDLFPRLAEFA